MNEHRIVLRVPAKGELQALITSRLDAAKAMLENTESEVERLTHNLEAERRARDEARKTVQYWERELRRLTDRPMTDRPAYPTDDDIAQKIQRGINARLPRTTQEPPQKEMFGHLSSDSPNVAPMRPESAQKARMQTMDFSLRVYEDTDVPLLERNVRRVVSEVLREHYYDNRSAVGVAPLPHDGYGHVKWDDLKRVQTIEVKVTIEFSEPENFDVLYDRLRHKLMEL